MAARKAGVISINLNAGTAKFVADMDTAAAKVRQFGRVSHEAHSHTVTDVQATSATLRTLSGRLDTNFVAAERFLASVLRAGPILKVAFPVVGAIALGGELSHLVEQFKGFYESIRDGEEKARGAMRGLNAPLRETNDELQLANDRLLADIAKIEGTPQNNLAIALDTARVAADKLADSLDKDLERLHKVLEEQNTGFWQRLFGEPVTADIAKSIGGDTGLGGFRGEIERITGEGRERIGAAGTIAERNAAQVDLNVRLREAYDREIQFIQEQLSESETLSKPHQTPEQQRLNANLEAAFRAQGGKGEFTPRYVTPARNEGRRIELLRGALERLESERAGVGLSAQNFALTERKQAATDAKTAADTAADIARPFEERMQSMALKADALRAKLEAIGKPESARTLAEAYAQAAQSIAEIDRQLAKHHTQLTETQREEIQQAEITLAETQAEVDWKTRLEQSAVAIRGRIEAQNALAVAIRGGYQASRAATVEARLRSELGARADDTEFLRTHAGDVRTLRAGIEQEFDAEHGRRTEEAIAGLNQQIERERELAAVQAEGAEGIRRVTLAYRIRELAAQGAMAKQIEAEIRLSEVQRAAAVSANLAALQARTDAARRLERAVPGGAEAVRQAELENKYAELARGGASRQEIQAQRELDVIEHQREIETAAIHVGRTYQDQLDTIEQQRAALQRMREEQGATFEIEVALRDLENQRLKTLADQALAGRTARDGIRAFFIEMQRDAKGTAQSIYDALTSAREGLTAEAAKALTGQANFGRVLQTTGEGLLRDTLDRAERFGLRKFGGLLGIDLGGKPDGTAGNPLYVKMAGATPALPDLAAGLLSKLKIPTGFGQGAKAGGFIFSLASDVFGGFRASGGPVDAGRAYVVGEAGPELIVPRSDARVVPNGEWGGGSSTVVYQIDARGADLGAANRMRRALEATHRSAVATAVRAVHERQVRTPGGRR